jgi:hypothetical protein
MILVLAAPADRSALLLARRLASFGCVVEVVTPMELVTAPRLAQRIGGGGAASELALRRFGRVETTQLSGVVNRLAAVPEAQVDRLVPHDRGYAAAELAAVLASWLYALPCPVVNRPTATSLSGAAHSELVWRHMAAAAGFATGAGLLDVDRPEPAAAAGLAAVVFRDRWFGPIAPPAGQRAGALLARLASLELMEIGFRRGRGGFEFVRATAMVDFERGGRALVRALALAFGR